MLEPVFVPREGRGHGYVMAYVFNGERKASDVAILSGRNKLIATSGRYMARESLTRVSARLLRPVGAVLTTDNCHPTPH